MGLRERTLEAKDIDSEDVFVPQWGETFEVRSMSAKMRARLIKRATVQLPDGKGLETDFEQLYPQIVIATCFDPETGIPVFGPGDHDALSEKNGAALEVLALAGMRLSGMTAKAVPEAKKDSSSTASPASS